MEVLKYQLKFTMQNRPFNTLLTCAILYSEELPISNPGGGALSSRIGDTKVVWCCLLPLQYMHSCGDRTGTETAGTVTFCLSGSGTGIRMHTVTALVPDPVPEPDLDPDPT